MSLGAPRRGCVELDFPRRLRPSDETAIEDYARTLTGARTAEAIMDRGVMRGLHLCFDAESRLAEELKLDIIAFALGLSDEAGNGLGWS